MIKNIRIRSAEPSDLPRLVELSEQLGYPNSIASLTRRFEDLVQSAEHRLVVAEGDRGTDSIVAGLLYLKLHKTLFVESGLEVGGIVVDQNFRGCGVGRMLMGYAEDVAKEWGLYYVRLSSNVKRADAHMFYESIGYERMKTSYFFRKTIS